MPFFWLTFGLAADGSGMLQTLTQSKSSSSICLHVALLKVPGLFLWSSVSWANCFSASSVSFAKSSIVFCSSAVPQTSSLENVCVSFDCVVFVPLYGPELRMGP